MRLFLALLPDEKMNKTLTSVMHDLKVHDVKGKYVPSQNLHVTLVFIGETDREEEISAAVSSVPVPSMRLTLDRLAMYGSTLVAEAGTNQKLKEYVADVRKALDTAGIAYDHKKFVPHITLVRKASENYKSVQLPKGSMTDSRVSLMKSSEKDSKRIYTEIRTYE